METGWSMWDGDLHLNPIVPFPLSVSSFSVTYRNKMVQRIRLWLQDFASVLSWATEFWYDLNIPVPPEVKLF